MKKILLLTNGDYDNVGDQMIEACDVALIRAALKNLGAREDEVSLQSRGVSLVPNEYVATHDPTYLREAEEVLKGTDLLLFGGAPVFNYRYESFYEKTATWLDLAAENQVPVIFSAIGVEHFEEDNPKCRRIREALRKVDLIMATTRDGQEQLQKYTEGLDMIRGNVADPAVYTREIFATYVKRRDPEKKRVGIFLLRANGFLDNGQDFDHEKAAGLWLELMEECEGKGFVPYLLTSGFAADEAFMDYMIRHYHVPKERCIFNINTPEDLVEAISGMDGIISCRLHPGILSYSLGIPAVGIRWNPKVDMFYHKIGHPERALKVEGITGKMVLDHLLEAMEDIPQRDEDMAYETYRTLVEGIQKAVYPGRQYRLWDFLELTERLETYPGTGEEAFLQKLQGKFRRAYVTYNNAFYKGLKTRKQLQEMTEKADSSHRHALALKEKNLQQQEKIERLKQRNIELKQELQKNQEELKRVYSQSFIEMVANWSKGKDEYDKKQK